MRDPAIFSLSTTREVLERYQAYRLGYLSFEEMDHSAEVISDCLHSAMMFLKDYSEVNSVDMALPSPSSKSAVLVQMQAFEDSAGVEVEGELYE